MLQLVEEVNSLREELFEIVTGSIMASAV
jgi:hypothetical protein